jgi:16S rRNA (guanine(966)-N(2))-methyltransferase RsmD
VRHSRADARKAGGPAHRIRIIGGRWKRTPLTVPDVEGLRPTPDRVRETLFNWLGRELDGLDCLDLFAGTGALGLEAASRGAAQVLLVESDRRAVGAISSVMERLDAREVTLLRRDALSAIADARDAGRRFDLVFLDPPFGQGWLERVLPLLPAVLAPGARVYVESEAPLSADVVARLLGPGWNLVRADSAGQVFYHLLRETNSEKG